MTHPALRGLRCGRRLAALSLSRRESILKGGREEGGRERAFGDKSEKRKKKRPRQIATDSASEEERAGGRETRGMNRVSQNRVDYELAFEPTPRPHPSFGRRTNEGISYDQPCLIILVFPYPPARRRPSCSRQVPRPFSSFFVLEKKSWRERGWAGRGLSWPHTQTETEEVMMTLQISADRHGHGPGITTAIFRECPSPLQ